MNPLVFFHAAILFMSALLFHVLIWRVRIPRHDALALFLIFSLAPFFAIAIFAVVQYIPFHDMNVPYILLLYAAFSVFYISSYPAAQAISPSLDILLIIGSSPAGHMTKDVILSYYNEEILVKARIEDLGRSSLVRKEGDAFSLTLAGRFVARFFVTYRGLLGLSIGQG